MARGLVLFDLDGTLIDTAPDLCGAANRLRLESGLTPLPYKDLRPFAGTGAKGLLAKALNVFPDNPRYPELRARFLSDYSEHMRDNTVPFAGIDAVLQRLAAEGRHWGIVTNKAMRLAGPLVQDLIAPIAEPDVLIAGDTTPKMKPAPDSLWEAARRLAHPVTECLYIGDEKRDITASSAAGMASIAALWGYGTDAQDWGATALARRVSDLPSLIDTLLASS